MNKQLKEPEEFVYDPIRQWYEEIGRKGGLSRSDKKRKAGIKNAAKAREAKRLKRMRKWQHGKDPWE